MKRNLLQQWAFFTNSIKEVRQSSQDSESTRRKSCFLVIFFTTSAIGWNRQKRDIWSRNFSRRKSAQTVAYNGKVHNKVHIKVHIKRNKPEMPTQAENHTANCCTAFSSLKSAITKGAKYATSTAEILARIFSIKSYKISKWRILSGRESFFKAFARSNAPIDCGFGRKKYFWKSEKISQCTFWVFFNFQKNESRFYVIKRCRLVLLCQKTKRNGVLSFSLSRKAKKVV